MTARTPIWYRALLSLHGIIAPAADTVVRSEAFAVAVGLVHRTERELRTRGERLSRHTWHLLNLPAATDLRGLIRQVGLLERQVRDLEKRLLDSSPVCLLAESPHHVHAGVA